MAQVVEIVMSCQSRTEVSLPSYEKRSPPPGPFTGRPTQRHAAENYERAGWYGSQGAGGLMAVPGAPSQVLTRAEVVGRSRPTTFLAVSHANLFAGLQYYG